MDAILIQTTTIQEPGTEVGLVSFKFRSVDLSSGSEKWFSAFLTLSPCNTIPHVLVTPAIPVILLLL